MDHETKLIESAAEALNSTGERLTRQAACNALLRLGLVPTPARLHAIFATAGEALPPRPGSDYPAATKERLWTPERAS